MSSRQSNILVRNWGETDELCLLLCNHVEMCVPVCLHMYPRLWVPQGVHVCVHACGGFLLLLHLCVCSVCTWRMKACGPLLMRKRENVCSQTLKYRCFWKVKALSTQPWRLDPGHRERLSQPAVSEPSQKDLRICFQLGRLLFSGQKFGSQTILADILSYTWLFSLFGGEWEMGWGRGTTTQPSHVWLSYTLQKAQARKMS